MIQADAVSTPEPGFFATLKSILFSGAPGAGTRVRRAPDIDERATLRGIAIKVENVIDGHGPVGDAELVRYLDHDVLEPVRELIRGGAMDWAEPQRGMLAEALYEADGNVWSLFEYLIDRNDLIDALDEFATALRQIARS